MVFERRMNPRPSEAPFADSFRKLPPAPTTIKPPRGIYSKLGQVLCIHAVMHSLQNSIGSHPAHFFQEGAQRRIARGRDFSVLALRAGGGEGRGEALPHYPIPLPVSLGDPHRLTLSLSSHAIPYLSLCLSPVNPAPTFYYSFSLTRPACCPCLPFACPAMYGVPPGLRAASASLPPRSAWRAAGSPP